MAAAGRLRRLAEHLASPSASASPSSSATPAPSAAAAALSGTCDSAAAADCFSADKLRGALYGMFIGDALAVPAHWYYNRDHLVTDYATLTGYTQVKETMPGSFLERMTYDAVPGSKADILHGEAAKYGAGVAVTLQAIRDCV